MNDNHVELIAADIPWGPSAQPAVQSQNGDRDGVLPDSEWPAPMGMKAHHGIIGELVRLIEPHTEADPAALVLQAIVMLGNIIGPDAYFIAEGSRHRLVFYAVLVGQTAKGRKGSSYNSLKRPLEAVEGRLGDPERVVSGLSSGEGLIWAVRDPIINGDAVIDSGVADKRLLVVEEEFARVLKAASRDGNILSAVIRQSWDTGNLGVITKTNRAKATGAHISIIGHITRDELRRYLSETESGNGFGNRFLWGCVKRSKTLPEGGELHRVDFGDVIRRLREVVAFGERAGELRRNDDARAYWASIYPDLSEGQPGMFGAMTSRAEAQVMRIACLYAIGDMSYVVKREHLEAAEEVWRYCSNSARFVFGNSLGDPVADEIDAAIKSAGVDGLSRTDLRDLFGRNRMAAEIGRALTLLVEHGRVQRHEDRSGRGRPVERWIHTRWIRGQTDDINDIKISHEKGLPLRHTTKAKEAEVPNDGLY